VVIKKADCTKPSVHKTQVTYGLTYQKTVFFQRLPLRPGDSLLTYTVLWDAMNMIMKRILC
jgi:hypothetical protein